MDPPPFTLQVKNIENNGLQIVAAIPVVVLKILPQIRLAATAVVVLVAAGVTVAEVIAPGI